MEICCSLCFIVAKIFLVLVLDFIVHLSNGCFERIYQALLFILEICCSLCFIVAKIFLVLVLNILIVKNMHHIIYHFSNDFGSAACILLCIPRFFNSLDLVQEHMILSCWMFFGKFEKQILSLLEGCLP